MRISIITINFNNKEGLEETIASVINQTYPNIEYIIIDGGSTDGSVEVIKEHEDKIMYWVSEPDRGIYHAMNKGVEKGTGDYFLMLNSGDYLINDKVLENMLSINSASDIIYGNVIWVPEMPNYPSKFPDTLNFSYFFDHSLGHQATLISKKVHEIVGLYDEELEIVSDWKLFLLAIFKYQLSYKHINLEVSVCDRNGMSCLENNFPKINFERKKILEKEFKNLLVEYQNLVEINNIYKRLHKKRSLFKDLILSKIKKIITK